MNDEFTILCEKEIYVTIGNFDDNSRFFIHYIEDINKDRSFLIRIPLIDKYFITDTIESAQGIILNQYLEYYRNDILNQMALAFDDFEMRGNDFCISTKKEPSKDEGWVGDKENE